MTPEEIAAIAAKVAETLRAPASNPMDEALRKAFVTAQHKNEGLLMAMLGATAEGAQPGDGQGTRIPRGNAGAGTGQPPPARPLTMGEFMDLQFRDTAHGVVVVRP